MSETTLQVPEKSRVDIIDTAIQRQKELKTLKFLLVLLLLTIFYEFQEDLWSLLPAETIEIPEVGREGPRRVPPKRLQRLTGFLADLQEEMPIVRFPLKASMESLAGLAEAVAQKPGSPAHAAALAGILQNAERLLRQPIWKDQDRFATVLSEMAAIRRLLRLPELPPMEVPRLRIGPRRPEAVEVPQRNLFSFGL